MADYASDSQFQSAKLSPRHICSSFFDIPGFFTGFGSKILVDSDSVRSPTSPLDLCFLSSLSNPFGQKSPTQLAQTSHQQKWEGSKVGLGIVKLLADETKPISESVDSPRRKNIIFSPQVKNYGTVRSNSLPKNFTISLLCKTKTPNSRLYKLDTRNESEEVSSEVNDYLSTISSVPTTNLTLSGSCLRNQAAPMATMPLLIASGSPVDNVDVKSSSLPIPIESGHRNVGSLSAREIQLSEDYTCIISHGPNPKTTHIFGDCILECQAEDLPNSRCRTKQQEVSALDSSNEFLSICCEKNQEIGDNIGVYSGEKVFHNFDCRSADIFSEDETDDFCKSSPCSSYNEDLFLIGLPMVT